jgi:hypothetical protein
MNAITTTSPDYAALVERVLVNGDLSKLTPVERMSYYKQVCESTGLNPLTKPFEYITLNGKMVLYALRGATDQLRSIHKISVLETTETEREGVLIITTKVQNAEGRTDIARGAVNIAGLKGEVLANAILKAETKAKRRATLSICGLGLLDETEVESIPNAVKPSQHDVIHQPMQDPDIDEGVRNWCDKEKHFLNNCISVADVNQWEELRSAELDRLKRKALPAWSDLVKYSKSRIEAINKQGSK